MDALATITPRQRGAQAAVLAITAAGAAAVGTVATRARVRQTTRKAANLASEGAGVLVQGALAWSEEYERSDARFRGVDGRMHRLWSNSGAFAFYMVVVEQLRIANRYGTLLRERVPPPRYSGGRYDLRSLSATEKALVLAYVDQMLAFGSALRVLGRVFGEQGLGPASRPNAARRHKLSLQTIRFVGPWNPLADRPEDVVTMEHTAGWRALGVRILAAFTQAYEADLVLTDEARRTLVSDVQANLRDLQEVHAGRVANPLPAAGSIAVVIVAVGAAVALYKATQWTATYLGYNVAASRAALRELERILRECREGDERACELIPEYVAAVKEFEPTPAFRALAIAGAAAISVFAVALVLRHRRRLSAAAAAESIALEPGDIEFQEVA